MSDDETRLAEYRAYAAGGHPQFDGRLVAVSLIGYLDRTALERDAATLRAERAEAQLAALRDAGTLGMEGDAAVYTTSGQRTLVHVERNGTGAHVASGQKKHEAAINDLVDAANYGAAVRAALADTAAAAEAHDRRVRAEALREAADALRGRGEDSAAALWLRARADEIERGA